MTHMVVGYPTIQDQPSNHYRASDTTILLTGRWSRRDYESPTQQETMIYTLNVDSRRCRRGDRYTDMCPLLRRSPHANSNSNTDLLPPPRLPYPCPTSCWRYSTSASKVRRVGGLSRANTKSQEVAGSESLGELPIKEMAQPKARQISDSMPTGSTMKNSI